MIRASFLCLLLLLTGPALTAQCPADPQRLDKDSAHTIFGPQAKSVLNAFHLGHDVDETINDNTSFLVSWAATRTDSSPLVGRLADLELDRWNKETSSGSGASGSTSITSKGSVGSLFSFAVENGALTRSESGTTLTFRTSPANVLAALGKTWWEAGPNVPNFDGSFTSIAKRLSFFVSFDASRGNSSTGTSPVFTGDRQQFSGWGTRFEIINKRDPRRAEYRQKFSDLMRKQGKGAVEQLHSFDKFPAIPTPALGNVKTHLSDEAAILEDYTQADVDFRKSLCALSTSTKQSDKDLYQQTNVTADKLTEFLLKDADIFNDIARSLTLAVEYNFTRQANTNGSLPASMAVSTASPMLPDLGNINLVASKGFTDGPELTANAGFTWFQNLPAGSTSGRIRDARVSAEFSYSLPEIKKIGKTTVSVSGLFLSLLEQPLGQQVLVNTVPVSRTGNIGLVQGKLTIPTKDAVSIPISVTWASRTELVKESDVRGNIGITFDLDKLFAKGEIK
jgi:hypothetical protein